MRSVVPINHPAHPPSVHTLFVHSRVYTWAHGSCSVDTTIRTIAHDTNRGGGGLNRAVTWNLNADAIKRQLWAETLGDTVLQGSEPWRIVVAATTKSFSVIQPSIHSHLNERLPPIFFRERSARVDGSFNRMVAQRDAVWLGNCICDRFVAGLFWEGWFVFFFGREGTYLFLMIFGWENF